MFLKLSRGSRVVGRGSWVEGRWSRVEGVEGVFEIPQKQIFSFWIVGG